MASLAIAPDTTTYNTAMNSCLKSRAWTLALHFLGEMRLKGVRQDTISFNTAISVGAFSDAKQAASPRSLMLFPYVSPSDPRTQGTLPHG